MTIKLEKAISASDVVIMLDGSVSQLPTSGSIRIGSEEIAFLESYKDTLYGCIRGVNSTTPASHAKKDRIEIESYYYPVSSGVTFPLAAPEGIAFATDSLSTSTLTFDTTTVPSNPCLVLETGIGNGGSLVGADNFLGLGCDPAFLAPHIYIDVTQIETRIDGNIATFLDATGLSLVNSFKADLSVTAGDTRMLLWDVDAGALVRVLVGANDSGGTGYKMLRVLNS